MPSHTEKERAKVRKLISRPIDSLSGKAAFQERFNRRLLNLKANPRARPRIKTNGTPSVPTPIINNTQPTDITGKAQNISELIKKRQRLLKNF